MAHLKLEKLCPIDWNFTCMQRQTRCTKSYFSMGATRSPNTRDQRYVTVEVHTRPLINRHFRCETRTCAAHNREFRDV